MLLLIINLKQIEKVFLRLNKIIVRKITLLLSITLLTIGSIQAQRGMRWKRTRYELTGGLGMSSFMGDLGGGKRSDDSFVRNLTDYNLLSSRAVLWGGMRYRLSPSFAVRGTLLFGQLSGNDKFSGDEGRAQRNLNFRTILIENSYQIEYSLIKENNVKKWSKRNKRKVRGPSFNLYSFVGIGGFYFNPKGEDLYGNWVALQPLGTEGQTADGNNNKYSRFSVCVPYGLGMKIGLSPKWDFGFEYGLRYTLTDYIDDVGTSYYDNKKIVEANGGNTTAGWLADKHIVTSPNEKFGTNIKNPNSEYYGIYQEGDRVPYKHGTSIRGGKANDVYMFFLFSLNYKLETKRNGWPKF